MKKILILAYDFPPYVSIGGLRPYSWYKYLKEFGLEPIIITRQWSNKHGNHLDYIEKSDSIETIVEQSELGKIIKTSFTPNIANRLLLKYGDNRFRIPRKIFSLLIEYFQFIITVGNKKNILIEARKYLKGNSVDYILATSEPFILFHYANKLSREFSIPWAGDYRDPWVLNTSHMVSILLKHWYSYHEKRLLKSMNMIVTVSEFMGVNINKYNKDNIPVSIVSNGFDQDLVKDIKELPQNSDVFTLAYAGTLYPYHPYRSFFDVLNSYKLENPQFKFCFKFYGINKKEELSKVLHSNYPEIEESIKFYPRLPNKDLLVKLSEANALVLFNEYSFMGTKIYDYMGVNRFIIHCFNTDEDAINLKITQFPMENDSKFSNKLQEEIINLTKTGKSVDDKVQLKKLFNKLFLEFTNSGKVSLQSRDINKFSRKGQAEKLAKSILEQISKN